MKALMNEELLREMKRAGENAVMAEMITGSFKNNFNELLERKDIRKGEIASASNISDKTLWRLRNEDTYIPSIQTIVAVCVGMGLSYPESTVLIELSPYRLRQTVFQEAVYTFILQCDYQLRVDEINIYLDALGCEKLGNVM